VKNVKDEIRREMILQVQSWNRRWMEGKALGSSYLAVRAKRSASAWHRNAE
jgi:hypothetical protein